MTDRDKIRFDRLIGTYRRNFEITRLYSLYLTSHADAITKEMIDTLTEDGIISREDAISAILSEMFGLDFDNAEDRRLIMEYITPSICLLNKEKYENDPYYLNIHLDNVKEKKWEIRCLNVC